MARRGTFGRQPRPAPNLTNTLIAIAREMQQQRDMNIMSAWEKGGEFEGRQVTDEMVLAHWRERMAGVSKDDPMYDTFHNAYIQYDYAINESKMSVRYAQGRISDSQMAAFYLKWAKKVPKNSEFYRVLQRDAAQFSRAAKAKSDAELRRAKEQAYNDKLTRMHDSNEKSGEYITGVLTALAQSGQQQVGIPGLIAGPGSGSDLTQFDSSDPEMMLRLLGLVTPTVRTDFDQPGGGVGVKVEATDRVLFHEDPLDPTSGVTGVDIIKKLRKLDPNFSGVLTHAYVKDLIKQQRDGVQKRIDLANKTGHITDANQFQKQLDYLNVLGKQVNAWPVEQSYMHAREGYMKVANDTSATPQAKLDAWHQYQKTLTDLSKDPAIAADDRFKGALLGEAAGTAGTVTIAESFTQMVDSEIAPTKGFVAQNELWITSMEDQVTKLNTDPKYHLTQGQYNDDGSFTPKVGGPSIGVAHEEDIRNLAGSQGDARFIYVPTTNGPASAVMMVDAPVRAVAIDPTTGEKMAQSNDIPVATVYTVHIGATDVKVYGYEGTDGRKVFSTEEPWDASRVSARTTDAGIELDVSKVLAPGQPGFTPTVVNEKGDMKLFLNPKDAALNSDATRAATLGQNALTEFYSPTLAAISSMPDGAKTLSTLMANPQFKAQLDQEAKEAAGWQKDAKGVYVAPDQNATDLYNKYTRQTQNASTYLTTADAQRFFAGAQGIWDKGVESMKGVINVAQSYGQNVDRWLKDPTKALELDRLDGTQYEPFGRATIPGTNQLTRFAGKEADDKFAIRLQGSLKVPSYQVPGPKPTPGPTPKPTPGATVKPFQAPTAPTPTPTPPPRPYDYWHGK